MWREGWGREGHCDLEVRAPVEGNALATSSTCAAARRGWMLRTSLLKLLISRDAFSGWDRDP